MATEARALQSTSPTKYFEYTERHTRRNSVRDRFGRVLLGNRMPNSKAQSLPRTMDSLRQRFNTPGFRFRFRPIVEGRDLGPEACSRLIAVSSLDTLEDRDHRADQATGNRLREGPQHDYVSFGLSAALRMLSSGTLSQATKLRYPSTLT